MLIAIKTSLPVAFWKMIFSQLFGSKNLTQLTDVVLMVQKELDKIHQIIQFHATKVKCYA